MRKPSKKKLNVDDPNYSAGGDRAERTPAPKKKFTAQENPTVDLLEKYKELYDLSPSGYFTLDKPGVILDLNLSAAILLGRERSSLLNQSFLSNIAAAHQDTFQFFLNNIFKTGVKSCCEIQLKNDFKPLLFVHIDGAVLANGEQCILAIADITGRHRTEAALKGQQDIFELSLDLHCSTDAAGFFKVVNPSWTRILGWTPEEIMSRHSSDLIHPDDRIASQQVREKLLRGSGIMQFENRLLCKDGAHRWIEWNVVANATDNTIVSVGRDVTERKQVEAENRKLAMIANLTINAVLLTDSNGLIQWSNDGFERLTGYGFAEVERLNVFDFLLRSGTSQEVMLYLRSCFRHKKACRIELLNFSKSGSAYWADVEIVPMKDAESQVTGFMLLQKDITDKKKTETALLNENEDLSKRAEELTLSNEELERFAYVASHDLQEPLRMVSSFMQLLIRNYEPLLDEKAREYVRFAVDGADRMKMLIMDLLEYSRVGTNKDLFQPTDLNDVLHEIEVMFGGAGDGRQLTLAYPPMPVIFANQSQVTQLLQNLLGNAVKYKGKDQAKVEINWKEEAHHYLFSVADNGIGISPKYFEKIFVLFQRLHVKEEYSGTGIGLAICKKIVELHGGTIWVESIEGKGSTFFFTIKKAV